MILQPIFTIECKIVFLQMVTLKSTDICSNEMSCSKEKETEEADNTDKEEVCWEDRADL